MFSKNGISNIMEQAKKMQEKMNKIQQEISKVEITGESGAGLVKVTLNGSYNCIKINIDISLIKNEEQELIEDLIAAAINDAARRIRDMQKEKMSNISELVQFPFNLKMPI